MTSNISDVIWILISLIGLFLISKKTFHPPFALKMNLKGFGVIRAVRTADSTDLWVAGSKCVNAKRQLHPTDHGVSVKVVARTSDRKRSGGGGWMTAECEYPAGTLPARAGRQDEIWTWTNIDFHLVDKRRQWTREINSFGKYLNEPIDDSTPERGCKYWQSTRKRRKDVQPSGLHLFKDCTNGWSLKGNGIVENQSPIDAKVHASQALKKLQILKEDLINFLHL